MTSTVPDNANAHCPGEAACRLVSFQKKTALSFLRCAQALRMRMLGRHRHVLAAPIRFDDLLLGVVRTRMTLAAFFRSQEACATAPKGVDPDIAAIAERMSLIKHKVHTVSQLGSRKSPLVLLLNGGTTVDRRF